MKLYYWFKMKYCGYCYYCKPPGPHVEFELLALPWISECVLLNHCSVFLHTKVMQPSAVRIHLWLMLHELAIRWVAFHIQGSYPQLSEIQLNCLAHRDHITKIHSRLCSCAWDIHSGTWSYSTANIYTRDWRLKNIINPTGNLLCFVTNVLCWKERSWESNTATNNLLTSV